MSTQRERDDFVSTLVQAIHAQAKAAKLLARAQLKGDKLTGDDAVIDWSDQYLTEAVTASTDAEDAAREAAEEYGIGLY